MIARLYGIAYSELILARLA